MKITRSQEQIKREAIKSIAAQQSIETEPEVLAEAYRIAGGDIALLRCPAYSSGLDSPELFRSLVLGELPEEAISCASRARKNLLDEFGAVYSANLGLSTVCPIGESAAWVDFLQQGLKPEVTSKPVIALVLCGGRSTRMGSTIPKPILPLRRSLLLNPVRELLARATNEESEIFAAVGFRSALVRRAFGGRVRYLEFAKTLGLAFRVATCLELLSRHVRPVILAYTDMPLVSYKAVQRLLEKVKTPRTFGLLTSHAEHLSGHIIEQNGKIVGVVQKRLYPDRAAPRMGKDVGVYVFYNTPEFREAVLRIKNDNIRGEYIFADVVQILAEEGWAIVSSDEQPDHAQGINTAGELLSVACAAYRTGVGEADLGEMYSTLSTDYRLVQLRPRDIYSFREALLTYASPLHYFQWWDEHWAHSLS
jgi:CTP:molybdopterin cytidylyltransferase MocA